MLAAALAEGTTVIENASRDPDVTACAQFLRKAGASIEGIGSSTMVIKGAKRLHETEFAVVPDRLEAGTLLIAGAATRGDVLVHPVVPAQLESVIAHMRLSGVQFEIGSDYIRGRLDRTPLAFDIVTSPYPGFPTDLHPPMVSYLCTCVGRAVVEETIFEGRLRYVAELRRMGANIRTLEQSAVVQGPTRLTGAPVQAPDTRAGAALIIAGLVADGRTEVSNAYLIARGYEQLDRKLREDLGAQVSLRRDQESHLRFANASNGC